MGTKDNGDWWNRLSGRPEILRAELYVYPEPDPYGILRLIMVGEPPLLINLPPTKVRILVILQDAFEENRGPVEPLPIRGRINRTQMATRYRKRAGIFHGIDPKTMTSYMSAFQRSLRRVLGVPPGVAFPDLLFVRENRKGLRNGVRMRAPGIVIHEIPEEE